MASLIPDFSGVPINTAGAMKNYLDASNNVATAINKPLDRITALVESNELARRNKLAEERQATQDARQAITNRQNDEMFKYKTDEIVQNQADKAKTEYTQGVLSQALMQEKPLEYIKKVNETEGGFNATVNDMTPILNNIRAKQQDEESARRFNIQENRANTQAAQSASLFNLQKQEYEDKRLAKENYATFVKSLDSINTKKETVDPLAQKEYNDNKNSLEAKLIGWTQSAERFKALGKEVPAVTKNEIAKWTTAIENLPQPKVKFVDKTEKEYLNDINEMYKYLPKDPTTDKNAIDLVQNRVKSLFPQKEGFTPAQLYKMEQDRTNAIDEVSIAHQNLINSVGKENATKYLKENPKATAGVINSYAEHKGDKKYTSKDYSKLTDYIAEAGLGSGAELFGVNDVDALNAVKALGKKYKVSDSELTAQFKLVNEGTWTDKGAIKELEKLLEKNKSPYEK